MQLHIPYHRGQCKPWNSIPRLNWGHPLTRGLISYGYDTGSGPIDLVTGSQHTVTNAVNPPFGGPKASQYGSGLTSVHTSAIAPYTLHGNTDIENLVVASPYSYACGLMNTSTPSSLNFIVLYTLCDATTVLPIMLGCAQTGTTDYFFQFGNAGIPNSTASGALKINTFQTLLGVALTDSTAACYVDGALSISPAGTTIAAATPGAIPTFHGLRGSANNTTNGFIYYAALWKGRALTASEARQLHDDPYCFLIYPEDEIFVSLTGGASLLLGDYVLDNGLNSLDTDCDKIFMCGASPSSYTDATSGANSLGNKNYGVGNAFGPPAARSGGGRQVTSIAITDGNVTANGTVAFWAAVDTANSRLLASGGLSGGKVVTNGQVFTLSAMTFGIPNA